MSGNDPGQEAPTLEMRLAAIEDKLARLTVTEQEMAAFNKVTALLASRGGMAANPAFSPQVGGLPSLRPMTTNTPGLTSWPIVGIGPTPGPVGIIIVSSIPVMAVPASTGVGFSQLGGG
jgi:hypothetical protein